MALTQLGPSWTDDVQIEERRLQEYLHKKQHSLLLRGAANEMRHTLEEMPTTNASDGLVHMGDSLMIRNACTGGLLQADVTDKVHVEDNSRTASAGYSVSTGTLLMACVRNVFTVSRVSDDDGFPSDGILHYGQPVRLGAAPPLHERPLYLFSNDKWVQGQSLAEKETMMCLYPRAMAGAHWRAVRLQAPGAVDKGDDIVRLGAPIRLECVSADTALGSDSTLRMTHYGNECRVFGTAEKLDWNMDIAQVAKTAWSFVDSQWADEVIAAAQKAAGGSGAPVDWQLEDGTIRDAKAYLAGLEIPKGFGHIDAGALLKDPTKRADHTLTLLELEPGSEARKLLTRIFPMIRNAGMHKARRLRRMCVQADTEGQGALPIRSFAGVLSWLGVRVKEEELRTLLDLLAKEGDEESIDYRRFFALMAPPMSEIRGSVVRDAYAKLRDGAAGKLVEVPDLQRNWRPKCHPDVQKGLMSESEAMDEFLRQWDVASADGLVSWEEFLDYYQDVSMAVESNEVFVEIVRRGWGL